MMKYICIYLFALIMVWLILTPNQGQCDLAPFHPEPMGGGLILKSRHESIRMESQDVFIKLKKTTHVVNAVFHFYNHGSTIIEMVGFPKLGYGKIDFDRFDVWVDGRKTEFREEHVVNGDNRSAAWPKEQQTSWLAQKVTFPGKSRTTIRVNYEAGYRGVRRSLASRRQPHSRIAMLEARWRAFYDYGTGSHWKGPIGLVAFTIDASEIGGCKNFYLGSPPGPPEPRTRPKPVRKVAKWQKA
jgi:hypothetical protein